MGEREILENQKWLLKEEAALVPRLAFKDSSKIDSAPSVNEYNKEIRDQIFSEVLSGQVKPDFIRDILLAESNDDLLISEIDRYGLPLRTVINKSTGLVRSNPYYSGDWLNTFYSRYYRGLYSNKRSMSYAAILAEQIGRGESYFNFVSEYLQKDSKILEIGCGMGGILIPFKIRNFEVKGIDLGEEFVGIGNLLGLNLFTNSVEDLINKGERFELIVLSHLIEHIVNLEEFLLQLKSLLTENGKIFIAVPGIKKVQETYNSNLHIYLQNAHVWSFSEATLKAILHKSGFQVIKSDEYINCLCGISKTDNKPVDLSNEAHDIINYLINTERIFKQRIPSEPGILFKILRKLKGLLN